MAKFILSGDLSFFRVELLVRFIEAIRLDGEIAVEGFDRGKIFLYQGKVIGALNSNSQGMAALTALVGQRTGAFTVSQMTSDELVVHADLQEFPDNPTLFRSIKATQSTASTVADPVAAPAPTPVVTVPAPVQTAQTAVPQAPPAAAQPAKPIGTMPQAMPPVAGARTPTNPLASGQASKPRVPGGGGPMARVPHMTDKGKSTLRSVQTNAAMRGTQVEGDTWKILSKVDGNFSLFQISSNVQIMGDRFNQAIDTLQKEGYIKFQVVVDETLNELARKTESKFRFGEYMVAKGIVSEQQLDTALRRQQELARRGRYMWLGEILVEMNFARTSQVQEALAAQKKAQAAQGG